MHHVRRVAMLSLHTSPLEQPGGGDAGGMNVYVRHLALELAAIGVAVDIYTRRTAAGQPDHVQLAGNVAVHHITAGPFATVSKEALPELVPEMADAVAAHVAALPGDPVTVIHSHYWVSGMAGIRVARQLDLPLVHTMHTMARVKNHHLPQGQTAEPGIRENGEQHIVSAATRLIANTTAEAAELEGHYDGCEQRIDVVSPGVDLGVFKPAFRNRSRQQLGIARQRFHIVFAGRLQRLKGPHVLVRAAALLRTERPDIDLQLTFLGARSGNDSYDLELMIDDAGLAGVASVLPPVVPEQLADWYRSADVVAVPSSSESFGLVALEAQACGTPVIATNVGGLPRAVSDGRTGLLVEGRSARLWADALASLHDFSDTRADMGRAASVFAESFGWENTAAQTILSYDLALTYQYVVPPGC
ncbi:D-inositol-3-phosphate glycosyltransferase [Arthrobacter sp. H35-D1]|uniref:D-inositol-3-phosphate glycosyltransferase n=1 Tax=Arthrobacter sp. H35-D1 TaxID=3046202 RepID=UPI0024B999C9|nr:D-inositol-3-phosphate glycosyltransferase [Arthrobacter sp. H35-D1]MDJ0315162.1 D-inositol-3-phosphate glycosyltransferase [Arthrobacter sp. H35-D1]